METVVPRTVSQGATVTAPPPTAQVSTPPPDLQRLQIGAKLDALVLQATSKGVAELNTPFGKIQLATTYPLPTNGSLQLQVIGKFPLLQLLITSVQGKSPQSVLRTGTPNASALPQTGVGNQPTATNTTLQSAQSRATSASVSLTVGTTVIATKLGPNAILSSIPSAAGQQTSPPTPGAQTGIGHTNQPAAGAKASSPTLTGPQHLLSAKGGAAPLTSGAAVPSNPNGLLNQAGSTFSVRITNLIPPSQLSSAGGLPTAGNALLGVGQSVTGVVTATTAQGQAIVQTHAGPVALSTPTPLPPGTTISFVVNAPIPNPAQTHNPLAGRNAEVILETHKWPELDDAIRTLTDSNPTVGQQVVNSILPKADATLAANILLLISAIRGGDIRNWFGDAPIRALQRVRPDLLNRLRDDFSQLAKLSDDTVSSDWRSFPVPFLNGSSVEQIRLFIKRKSDDADEDTEANQGARFIIDLDLSRLGKLQFDGLVKTHRKQFDLIIRSDDPLSSALQNQIRSIFVSAMDQTGHQGGLTFQAAPAHFLEIQSGPASTQNTGLVV